MRNDPATEKTLRQILQELKQIRIILTAVTARREEPQEEDNADPWADDEI